MTDPTANGGVPGRILLATDLSARCDRALERALWLAADWQAQLVILHVFKESHDPFLALREQSLPSWRRPADAVSIAKQRIRQGLRADVQDAVDKASVRVEEGDRAELIEGTAVAEGCGLIITGIAREVPFARQPVMLGSTVAWLLRHATLPILIVRNRARTSYRHVLVATDLSDISRYAVWTALRLFPSQTLRLLHAFQVPYSGLVSDPGDYEKSYREMLDRNLDAFLQSMTLSRELRSRIRPLIERGSPESLISQYVHDHDADLVVLGTHGRGAMLESLIGSTAKKVLATLGCDALVVRENAR